MPASLTYPGIYIDEVPSAVRTIIGVPTSIAAFVGQALRGPVNEPRHTTNWGDFERIFGGLSPASQMSYAVYHYYLNGGSEAEVVRVAKGAANATLPLPNGPTLIAASPGTWANNTLHAAVDHNPPLTDPATYYNLTVTDTGTNVQERYVNVSVDTASARSLDKLLRSSSLVTVDSLDPHLGTQPAVSDVTAGNGSDGQALDDTLLAGDQTQKQGIWALLNTDIFNILCLPDAGTTTLTAAMNLCVDRRAMLLVDPPATWTSVQAAHDGAISANPPVSGDNSRNAALYFPRIQLPDPQQHGLVRDFPPSGTVAGIYARTDTQRGVWKAPAGVDASLNGVQALTVPMTDLENGQLNPLGVNCLRAFPLIGPVVWGARTVRGADILADQWKYIPVRRTALYIEESLYRGTKWVVFEPNDEPLWSQIRLNVGAFMNGLFRQGAFQGRTPQDAYLVKCDSANNPQGDIDRGIVNILVGFAPLKPAEFVLIHIQQVAPQPQV